MCQMYCNIVKVRSLNRTLLKCLRKQKRNLDRKLSSAKKILWNKEDKLLYNEKD